MIIDREKQFWKWFAKNNGKYLRINMLKSTEEKEKLQSDLLSRLNEYSKGLYFEIGGQQEDKAHLIITAEGNTRLFEDVKKLVRKAPKLDNWKFIALKPPMGADFNINYEGLSLDPKNMWFFPLKNPEQPNSIGLRVGIPGYDPGKEKLYVAALFIILDTLLGEKSNAEDIGYIEVGSMPEQPAGSGYIELFKLPEFIEWKKEEQSQEASIKE